MLWGELGHSLVRAGASLSLLLARGIQVTIGLQGKKKATAQQNGGILHTYTTPRAPKPLA
jgi:hypothetical protein